MAHDETRRLIEGHIHGNSMEDSFVCKRMGKVITREVKAGRPMFSCLAMVLPDGSVDFDDVLYYFTPRNVRPTGEVGFDD